MSKKEFNILSWTTINLGVSSHKMGLLSSERKHFYRFDVWVLTVHTLKGFYSNYHQNKSREQLKINLTDFYSKLQTQNIKHKIFTGLHLHPTYIKLHRKSRRQSIIL